MKAIIFQIMSTFRWLIVTTSSIFSALMIFVLIFYMFNDTANQIANLIITFIVAVLSTAFSWYYDALLKKLEPKNELDQD